MERHAQLKPTELLQNVSQKLKGAKRWGKLAVLGAVGIALAACTPGNNIDLKNPPRNEIISTSKNQEKEERSISALREGIATVRDFLVLDKETYDWVNKLDMIPTFYTPTFTVYADQKMTNKENQYKTQVQIRPFEAPDGLSSLLDIQIIKNSDGKVISRSVKSFDDRHSKKITTPPDSYGDEPLEITGLELVQEAEARTQLDISGINWNVVANSKKHQWADQVHGTIIDPENPNLTIEIRRWATGLQTITVTDTSLEEKPIQKPAPQKPNIPTYLPSPTPTAPTPKKEESPIILPGTMDTHM